MKIYNFKKSIRFLRIFLPAYTGLFFRPAPIWAHLFVTRRCNLNCKYCYVRDNNKLELDEENMKKIIDKLYILGVRLISFFGGEPTIRKDFVDLLKYANNKGMITHFSTNGILLTSEHIERIGEAGIDVINLSVDSVFEFNDSTKDYIRSKKVLEDLITARKKFGFEINISLVLTRKNMDLVVKTVKLFDKYKIPIAVGLISQNTYSNQPLDKSLFFNSKKDKIKLYKLLEDLKELKKEGYNLIDPYDYFDGIKNHLENYTEWSCHAGKYFISVDCDGKFQICAGLKAEDISIFDIDKNKLKAMEKLRQLKFNWCKKMCFSNCAYDTSYFINHPFYFIGELFKRK
ncbi:MAG: radical SAM protein [Candidatus Nanoarchaeia archaeon]|nr:radical SAM protein [Candidatus Nanoarchaeia archaeon]